MFVQKTTKIMVQPSQKLTNLQLELLKTFSRAIPETQVLEIRQLLADYFARKVDEDMDALFEKNNWNTEQKVEEWLSEHMRTPYVQS